MHGMKEIIQEAASLPVEETAIVIDSLLRTLNPPDTEIEREWVKVSSLFQYCMVYFNGEILL